MAVLERPTDSRAPAARGRSDLLPAGARREAVLKDDRARPENVGDQIRKVLADQKNRLSRLLTGKRVEVTPRMVGAFLPAGTFVPSGRAETAVRAPSAAMRAGKGAIPVTGQGEVEQWSGSREYRLRCSVCLDAVSEPSSSVTSILGAYIEPQSARVVQHISAQRCIAPSALRCLRSQQLDDTAVPRPVTLVRPARSAFMTL